MAGKDNIIYFPTPKIPLTQEETEEYDEIKRLIHQAETLRQIWHCKKRVKAFMKKVKERHEER